MAFVYLRHDRYALALLGVAVVLVAARAAGVLFRRLRQPPVIGEVLAGIALGPSILGDMSHDLFPAEVLPLLRVLATVGLVVFMFFVGLELDVRLFSDERRRVAVGVALAGTVLPFAFGMALALALHPTHDQADLWPFALFMGAAMSITAFPVLARILVERELFDTPLGGVTMTAAAGDDVLTWATLSLVVAIVTSSGAEELPYICGMAVLFAVVMVKFVRPRLERFADRPFDATGLALTVVGIFVSSFVTATIGIHEIFGAFLFGCVFPRGRLADEARRLLDPVAVLLLPVFFVVTGLDVDLSGIGLQGLWQLALILVVACAGKLLGATVGARSQGLAVRESVALGVLMNTRGLTELVALNIGREIGVVDERLFTLLVVMAVVTTVATGPLLDVIRPDPWLGRPATGDDLQSDAT